MRVTGIVANLRVADLTMAKGFYQGYLGLGVEEFNLGWVARYTSPERTASVQLVTRDATAVEDSVISVHVGAGIDEAFGEARDRGLRDRSSTHGRTVGPQAILRACARRQRDQHDESRGPIASDQIPTSTLRPGGSQSVGSEEDDHDHDRRVDYEILNVASIAPVDLTLGERGSPFWCCTAAPVLSRSTHSLSCSPQRAATG